MYYSWQEIPVNHKPIQRLSLGNMKLEWVNSFKYLFHSSTNTIHCNLHAKHKVIQQEIQLSLTNRATHLCNIHMADPLKHAPPHICYYAEFNRSTSKGECTNREEPRKFGSAWAPSPWDREVAVPW